MHFLQFLIDFNILFFTNIRLVYFYDNFGKYAAILITFYYMVLHSQMNCKTKSPAVARKDALQPIHFLLQY